VFLSLKDNNNVMRFVQTQQYIIIFNLLVTNFNCCFTVHFDKFKVLLTTNALFIKT
jgi:hypothetical protein